MLSYYSQRAGCILRVSGPDATEFLQGQFSNDLSKMKDGEVVYGLWLDRKGKIVADSFVMRRGFEEYLLVSYYCTEDTVYERLDAFLIMEEVELARCTGGSKGLSVFGEFEIEEVLIPEKGRFCETEGVIVFWGRRGGEPNLEFVALPEQGEACIDSLVESLRGVQAHELGTEEVALEAIRSKTPRIGMSFGEKDLPQELGLDGDAVSFNKGCYLGQEVMARLFAMGRVRKHLATFRMKNEDTESLGALPVDIVDTAGKRQGQLREVAYSEFGGVALGFLSSSHSEGELFAGGVRLELEDE